MTSTLFVKAVVRNGRVETEEPINLPDGTPLLISVQNGDTDTSEDGWDVSPEGIAAWISWYDSLQPLKITPEEQTDTDAWLKKLNEHGSANRDKGVEDLSP